MSAFPCCTSESAVSFSLAFILFATFTSIYMLLQFLIFSSFPTFSSLVFLWQFPSFSLLDQMKYFHHVICFALPSWPFILSHEHSLICLSHEHLCISSNFCCFMFFKNLQLKDTKLTTSIKYLCYHNFYYVMCCFMTSVIANFLPKQLSKINSYFCVSSSSLLHSQSVFCFQF